MTWWLKKNYTGGKEHISNTDAREGFLTSLISGGLIGGDPRRTVAQQVLTKKKTSSGFSVNIKDSEKEDYLKSQIGTESPFAAVIDYILKSGDTTSDAARTFYKEYGQYMDTIKESYGMTNDWEAGVNELLSNIGPTINEQLKQMGFGEIDGGEDVSVAMKPYFDELFEAMIGPVQEGLEHKLNDEFKLDLTGVSTDTLANLSETLGITITKVNDEFANIKLDSAAINDKVIGWTQTLPDNISLDAANLSANDVQVLASAGIQINGDGTITFMKAMNSNMTGDERTLMLKSEDISGAVAEALKLKGLELDFSGAETKLNLDVPKLGESMHSALFKANDNLTGQMSDSMTTELGKFGKILDSGFVEITNKAILSGQTTVKAYLESLGYAFDENGGYIKDSGDELSKEVINVLLGIDDVIANEGAHTLAEIAKVSDGIVIESPLRPDQLTDEMRSGFAKVGVSFVEERDKLYAVINKPGEQVKNGLTVIPEETWALVNTSIVEELKKLGVSIKTEAGLVTVDLSTVMDNGIQNVIKLYTEQPDLWNQIPEQVKTILAEAGVMSENGMLVINEKTLTGMIQLQDSWYQYWSELPKDITEQLGFGAEETANGIMKIEEVAAGTKLGETIDGAIVVPFDKLPASIKQQLTGPDGASAAMKDSIWKIQTVTKDNFISVVDAVRESFLDVNKEAEEGAKSLARTIAEALMKAQQLNNVEIKSNFLNKVTGGKLSANRQKNGKWKVVAGGREYPDITARNREEAIEIAREIAEMNGFPAFKKGGLITGDGLYRAGEFGRTEAVIPLEDPAALAQVGAAIASYMPWNTVMDLSGATLTTLTDKTKIVLEARDDVLYAYYDECKTLFTEEMTELKSSFSGDIHDSASDASYAIVDALSELSYNLQSSLYDYIQQGADKVVDSIYGTTDAINDLHYSLSSIISDVLTEFDFDSDDDEDEDDDSDSGNGGDSDNKPYWKQPNFGMQASDF